MIKQQPEILSAEIKSLSHDGRGIAYINGKTTFINGSLPGEHVRFNYTRKHAKFDQGQVVDILTPSLKRVLPKCQHYAICGGCSLQHMDSLEQIQLKQKILLEQLLHFGQVTPEAILPPLTGSAWNYRRKARLSVKYVEKKQRLLVGFHEKNGRYVADLQHCEILHPAISLTALYECLIQLQIHKAIPQIEIAIGDKEAALVIRHLLPLTAGDIAALSTFGKKHNLHIYLQPKGNDSIQLLYPEQAVPLSYHLPEHRIELLFNSSDFIQVNAEINRLMVNRAIEWLDLQSTDRVLDLYCGLGNFTLPIARYAANVIGVEGSAIMVERASSNAQHNDIHNAEFYVADLDQPMTAAWANTSYDKLLLDPSRSGAYAIVQNSQRFNPKRIVYISCNPATLARDAGVLVNQQGYRLIAAGVMDMFPHTKHVEAMAVFVKN